MAPGRRLVLVVDDHEPIRPPTCHAFGSQECRVGHPAAGLVEVEAVGRVGDRRPLLRGQASHGVPREECRDRGVDVDDVVPGRDEIRQRPLTPCEARHVPNGPREWQLVDGIERIPQDGVAACAIGGRLHPPATRAEVLGIRKKEVADRSGDRGDDEQRMAGRKGRPARQRRVSHRDRLHRDRRTPRSDRARCGTAFAAAGARAARAGAGARMIPAVTAPPMATPRPRVSACTRLRSMDDPSRRLSSCGAHRAPRAMNMRLGLSTPGRARRLVEGSATFEDSRAADRVKPPGSRLHGDPHVCGCARHPKRARRARRGPALTSRHVQRTASAVPPGQDRLRFRTVETDASGWKPTWTRVWEGRGAAVSTLWAGFAPRGRRPA